jgi:transposase-like protein
LQKKSSLGSRQHRIPPETGGIQVNFCKKPTCANYGIPASQRISCGRNAIKDNYTISASGKGIPVLKCHGCGEHPPMKSNSGIAEEQQRLSGYLNSPPEPYCLNDSCPNHQVGIFSAPSNYIAFGKTAAGAQRYRCKLCKKTLTINRPTSRQRASHKNRTVFSLLMNKVPFRRICEVAEINPKTLYDKINFLHRQSQAFIGHRERKLLEGHHLRRVYVGVDRQDYVVNWTQRQDKRNIQLSAVGSADNETGYVFGMHLNYDPSLNPDQVEANAEKIGDCDLASPFRRYARVWLSSDYMRAILSGSSLKLPGSTLEAEIASTYRQTMDREDVEDFETPDTTVRLPGDGMQIHAEYTLYAHFFLLKRLFGGVEKVRFFLDQDSGMRAACLGAFQEEIKSRRCDAFYVRINKDLTIGEKKQALAASRKVFRSVREQDPGLTDNEIRLQLIKKSMELMREIGQWKDRWLTHPFPNMSEPEKAICYLTDYDDYDEDHQAWLYNKASLHAIDCFFMQVRRRLSLLERPYATASSARRMWHGYSAYNPKSIVKLLDIFRVYYNYCQKGQDGQTPAMRLGLAKGVVTLEDVIYYH